MQRKKLVLQVAAAVLVIVAAIAVRWFYYGDLGEALLRPPGRGGADFQIPR
ncbi:MAG: hypothetical protein K1X74_08760 [Pirellulales bacterium]|nr:hypothetical protein [Pirellulales bacterium]